MSYMATLPPHSLCAAPPCRGPSLPSLPCAHRRPRFSWWCQSSPLPAPVPSLSTSAAGTSCKLDYGGPETDQTGLSYGGCKLIEVPEQVNKHSMAHSLWFGLLLQWTLALETRRSFITGSVQRLSNCILSCCPPHLSPPPSGTISRRDKFARRVALMIPFLITASTSCNSLAKLSGAEETRNRGSSFLQNFGIGERDIYYPSIFAGSWVCNSTLVAVDTPQVTLTRV